MLHSISDWCPILEELQIVKISQLTCDDAADNGNEKGTAQRCQLVAGLQDSRPSHTGIHAQALLDGKECQRVGYRGACRKDLVEATIKHAIGWPTIEATTKHTVECQTTEIITKHTVEWPTTEAETRHTVEWPTTEVK